MDRPSGSFGRQLLFAEVSMLTESWVFVSTVKAEAKLCSRKS